MSKAVSVAVREDDRNPAHARVSVFVGRNQGARGRAGQIVLRTDEWEELKVWLRGEGDVMDFELLPDLGSSDV